jgi:hypothetical protein
LSLQPTTQLARVTTPIPYVKDSGRKHLIPVGPCLLESNGDQLISVIWGEHGQRSAALPLTDLQTARDDGHLVLLA